MASGPPSINHAQRSAQIKKGKALNDAGYKGCVRADGRACPSAGKVGKLTIPCNFHKSRVTKEAAAACPRRTVHKKK